jgi:WD40 repeat protein
MRTNKKNRLLGSQNPCGVCHCEEDLDPTRQSFRQWWRLPQSLCSFAMTSTTTPIAFFRKLLVPPMLLLLLAALLLSGCDLLPQPEPFVTGTPWPTFTPQPSGTPLPTATFTPTPYVAGLAGTPAASSSAAISERNLKKLAQLNRIGQGLPQALAWSDDGDLLAVASSRGLSLYDGDNLELLNTIDINTGPRSLDFTPNGEFILCGNNDGSLSLWNTTSGTIETIPRAHASAVFSVAVSPDGQLAASASWDTTIRLWRFTDEISQPLAPVRILTGHNEDVRQIMFSPDSERLFTWSPSRQVKVWQMPNAVADDELYIGTAGGGLTATALAFSPNGGLVAALQNSQMRIFNTDDGTTLSTLKPFKENVRSAALSDDGSLAATLESGTLKLWQADNGALLAEIALPETVNADALPTLSPNKERVILLSDSFWVWELPADFDEGETPKETDIVPAGFLPAFPFFTQFNADGSKLTSARYDGRLYEVPLDQPFATLSGPSLTGNPALMAVSDDLAWIGASSEQRLMVWPQTSNETQIASEKHWRNLSALTFSHDGLLAASTDGQGKLLLWDVAAGSLNESLSVPTGISSLVFSPEDSLLAVTSGAGVQLWQTADWSLLDSFNGTAAAFSPDGDFLAAAAWDEGEEVVFLRQIGRESTSIDQRIPVNGNALSFSPDGELLVVSGKSLTILRVSDGKILLELDAPLPFGKPYFSPDGTYLALSHWDGTVSLWGIP